MVSNMSMWVGTEKEGKFTGIKTLFIPNKDYMYEDIQKVIKSYPEIQQLYFGAGRCGPVSWPTVSKCIRLCKIPIITCEVLYTNLNKVPRVMYNKINIIVTIQHYSLKRLVTFNNPIQVKLQALDTIDIDGVNNDVLFIGDLNCFNQVNIKTLKGKKYKDDVVIKDE